jgi:hypothetical protein
MYESGNQGNDSSHAAATTHVRSGSQLTDELVQRVTDEVYRLFLRDLQLERERRGDMGLALHRDGRW